MIKCLNTCLTLKHFFRPFPKMVLRLSVSGVLRLCRLNSIDRIVRMVTWRFWIIVNYSFPTRKSEVTGLLYCCCICHVISTQSWNSHISLTNSRLCQTRYLISKGQWPGSSLKVVSKTARRRKTNHDDNSKNNNMNACNAMCSISWGSGYWWNYLGMALIWLQPWKQRVNRRDSFPIIVRNNFRGRSDCLARKFWMYTWADL